ncbi:MAG TPA: phage tail tube protein [Patescibacteria group bacterium]|nr:phage tail tube protein [Patescibacteria group bacterium]
MLPIARYAGFGEETVYGTAVPAVVHVDIASATLDAPSDTESYYTGGLGRGTRTRRPGYYAPAGNLVYGWDIRTIARLLRWTLGGYRFTTAPVITLTTSTATTDIINTSAPHGFAAGDRVRFPTLTGGAGLVVATDYFVITANLAAQTFQVSAIAGGTAVNFTTDITAGTVTRHPGSIHEAFASPASLLPSFTTRIGKDTFEHVFAGCVADSLELGLSDDFLLATMGVVAQRDSRAAIQATSTLLLPTLPLLAFHEVTLALPTASDVSPIVRDLSLSIDNSARPEAGRTIGSRFPRRIPVGAREVTMTAGLVFEGTAQLERFWGAVDGPAAGGATDFPTRIVADARSDGSLVLDVASAHFTAVPTRPSGRNEIIQTCEIRCLEATHTPIGAGGAVQTELLATVRNAAPTLP